MQYTPHYNLNLPEGTDIVNPLIQDNPNYSAIDAALYANKQRVIGTATHTKTGTNHSIVLGDSDINQFKFVATGDYATGDTFSVDGVTVTARVADGSSVPAGAFKINSTVMAILDGTILNLINITGAINPDNLILPSSESVEDAIDRIDNTFTSMAPPNGYYNAFPVYEGGGSWKLVIPVDRNVKANYSVSVIGVEVVNHAALTVTSVGGRNNSIIVKVSEDLSNYANSHYECAANLTFTHV